MPLCRETNNCTACRLNIREQTSKSHEVGDCISFRWSEERRHIQPRGKQRHHTTRWPPRFDTGRCAKEARTIPKRPSGISERSPHQPEANSHQPGYWRTFGMARPKELRRFTDSEPKTCLTRHFDALPASGNICRCLI